MCISPFRNVPFVSTILRALNFAPSSVSTPLSIPFSSNTNCTTLPCHISKFGVFSSVSRHRLENFVRSDWARGLHIAGPLLRLSIRNWMAVASVMIPIMPPRASISRTICPLAMPPTAGLQLIWAILCMSIVMRSVRAPIVAAAWAASQPA